MRRSRKARLWAAWAVRDARRRWAQVLAIALLLALGVGMYAAMSSLAVWRTRSADASFAALRMHNLRVSMPAGASLPSGSLLRALDEIPGRSAVSAADERLVLPIQVDASRPGRPIIVPGRLVGAPVYATVDRLFVDPGRPLRPADEGRAIAELDLHFAEYYHLPAAGTLRIAGGRSLRYVGQAQAPEYFVITAPGADFGAQSSLAVLFAPLRSTQVLAGMPGRVNELVLRVAPGRSVAAIQAQLAAALRRELPRIGFTFTRTSEEPAHRLIYKDASGDQQMMDVFAFLLLFAAVFAAFNLVSRSVEAERREIGIGMALGVPPRTLALRPLLLGLQVALLGVALGVPAGLGFDAWLRSIIASFFPLPVWRTPLQLDLFAQGAALGLLLPLAGTALALGRALRVTPVQAIAVGARSARSSGLAWLARGLRMPGGSLANLPLRNVLRTPRRTLMTVLGIGAVVSIVIALSGTIDSFDATLRAGRHEALAGAPDRIVADLQGPRPAGSGAPARIAALSAVGAVQPSLRMDSELIAGPRRIDAFTEVVAPRGRLWQPTPREGSLAEDAPDLAIAQSAASDLHVRIGDRLLVRHPVPSGPSSFRVLVTSLPVTAIHASPFRYLAYASPAAASALGVAGLVNRISVVPAAGYGETDVKRALLGLPEVAAAQGAAAALDAVDERMSEFNSVLVVTVIIAMAMALLIAFNSTMIATDERTREHATMFAYGVTVARVLRGAVIEAAAIGLLATAVGLAAGYGVLLWTVRSVMPDTIPDIGVLISIAPVTYASAVLAGVVIVALAPLLTARRLRDMDVPSALRVVE